MIVVQLHLGQLLADHLGLLHQPLGGLANLAGLRAAVVDVGAQLVDGDEQLGQPLVGALGAGGDLRHLRLDVAGQPGDAGQLVAGLDDLPGGGVQFASLLEDMGDHRFALLADVAIIRATRR